jgi:methyl-accepting chemotaxis protein
LEKAVVRSGSRLPNNPILDLDGKPMMVIKYATETNATIESARAGEAGYGFAVVASEVENLATQAKQATDKIANAITALNKISGDVVQGLGGIRKAIDAVSEYATSTAAAVEELNVVTKDISSNMQRAAAELS